MTELAARNYLERSRHDRRVELAKLAHDRHANLSVVMGLSLRVQGHQAHVDYTGGLDTARIYRGLTSPFSSSGDSFLSRIAHYFFSPDVLGRKTKAGSEHVVPRRETRGEEGGKKRDVSSMSCWKLAVAKAAPVDLHGLGASRLDAETAGEYQVRMRAAREKKRRDFAPVLARVDKSALANLARELLEQRRRRRLSGREAVDPVPLPGIGEPTFGSGYVFYGLRFPRGIDGNAEGVQWIVKIPAATSRDDGCGWDELACETLRSEAFLLHMLREETDVPVPEVIDADCRPNNEVGVPWLLMEYVEGRRLEDVWFGRDEGRTRCESGDGDSLKQRRETILRNVAKAMLELGRYEFSTGGALVFDRHHGELVTTTTAPLREVDVKAMVLRWFSDEECSTLPLYCRTGPWGHPRDMYTALLDAWPPDTVAERGVDGLLRLLLGLIEEPGTQSSTECVPCGMAKGEKGRQTKMRKKFVLTHPDLSMRNIVLAEDGTTIKAILGWDGARAAPRSLGNEALPRWLVRDFNPFVWGWEPAADFWRLDQHDAPACNRFEDPPWVLRELRGFYASAMCEERERHKRKVRKTHVTEGEDADPQNDNSGDEDNGNVDTDITKQSLLTLTLDAAIRDPRCRVSVLRRLLEKCSRPFEELDFDFFVDTLGEGHEMDPRKMKYLVSNMKELIDKGFVRGAVVW
ncbi:hypothetical protein F5B22DRAFT_643315 [Xylaria bambusicola]|uniref:uncharacterized protein n=1 Tax=Xylaria bambusicola TaxID=326684 RepID=UPI0020077CBB|nr:uncharacterized protein F5B22DRAFT_643315 [Xylaria bambusicola]KAI0522295.1 hypothetical protein F5B22DRAFT_643315 [Xylaria bambusicola]